MAFGRKKKNEQAPEVEPATAPAPASGRRSKKRRQGETLASVINETTVGAAVDVLKRNEQFALPNGSSWIGLLLATDEIGGLSQKHNGDEAKGSIIELIAADKIQIVATADMIEAEYIGIVPNQETLARMDEFGILRTARYHWVLFQKEGEQLKTDAINGVTAQLADASAIAQGLNSLENVLPEVWTWGGGQVEPSFDLPNEAVTEERELVTVGADAAEVGGDPLAGAYAGPGTDYAAMDEEPDAPAFPDFDLPVEDEPSFELPTEDVDAQFEEVTQGIYEPDETPSFETAWDAVDEAPAEEPEGDDLTAYTKYVVENEGRVVDETEVQDTIVRRFMSGDLGLAVDIEEFQKLFETQPAAIQLEIAEDPSDWLGSQIAQLSRSANAELEQLHRSHSEELLQAYTETMAIHVERTLQLTAIDNPESQYAVLLQGAEADLQEHRNGSIAEAAAEKRQIEERFEASAQLHADRAAANARATWEERNRPKLERDLAAVTNAVASRHEQQFEHSKQMIDDLRRKDALARMDAGTSRVFELLRARQAEQREQERQLLESWTERLVKFIDENRKHDIARSLALAEQLARTEQVETLKVEQAAHIERLQAEFANREARLNEELIGNREKAIAELEAARSSFETQISIEQDRTRGANSVIDELKGQVAALGTHYSNTYLGEINELKAAIKGHELAAERTHNANKRNGIIVVILVVVAAIASLSVGALMGWSWGLSTSADSVTGAAAATIESLLI